jgi:integrase
MGGLFFPVRRSLDYVAMKKGGQINKQKDNWFDKKQFYYVNYKTKKYYGEQTLPIPPNLKKIIDKYAKLMPHTDILLFDNNSQPLTSVKLNQRLCKIFAPKNVSCNLLRHAYLTAKFGDQIEKDKAIQKTMSEMGSSSSQLPVYLKHDD